MYRRLSLLPGLAILSVVMHHATGWGLVAMFFWTHRYRDVSVPNYDLYGSFSYWVTMILHNPFVFAVPAFLFVSGFFIAYAARGSQARVSWKTVGARVKNLIIPYLFWSLMISLYEAILGDFFTPAQYLAMVLLMGANGGYFFIPVLVTFYVLSPFIVWMAKARLRLLLVIVLTLQIIPILFRYIRLFWPELSWIHPLVDYTPDQLFYRWALYFPLGVIFGVHLDEAKKWLAKYKALWLALAIFSLLAFSVEGELVFRYTPDNWRPGPSSIFFHLYALSFIMIFLAYEKVTIPYSSQVLKVGNRSYGIYLVHFTIMQVVSKFVYHFARWLLSIPLLFEVLMYAVGLGGALLMMWLVTQLPIKKYYQYLFG